MKFRYILLALLLIEILCTCAIGSPRKHRKDIQNCDKIGKSKIKPVKIKKRIRPWMPLHHRIDYVIK